MNIASKSEQESLTLRWNKEKDVELNNLRRKYYPLLRWSQDCISKLYAIQDSTDNKQLSDTLNTIMDDYAAVA